MSKELHTPLDHVEETAFELSDTVKAMRSDDFKERFRAEYWQTAIRYHKLRYMLKDWRKGKLQLTPKVPYGILEEQLRAMGKYLKLLEIRAEIEEVDLERDIDE